ncbi:hypothetical protein BH10ACT8_BH10ACT8_05380 [soil metagenome]
MTEDNSHAGQGSVLLDIGGDIGALVVTMPASLAGAEIEIRPIGAQPTTTDHSPVAVPAPLHQQAPLHQHPHDHAQPHDHGHPNDHEHPNDHGHAHDERLVHVGVVGRPAAGRIIHSAVFGELVEGSYELYVRPDGPVQLVVQVYGGAVTEAIWP